LFASAFSPRADAVFDPQKLSAENGLDNVLAKQAIRGAFQVSLQCKFKLAGGGKPFDSYQAIVHIGSLFQRRVDGNSFSELDHFVPVFMGR